MKVKVYFKLKGGKLSCVNVASSTNFDLESYEEAINIVKDQFKVERALCLVENKQ